jgi:hypothetical protein
VGEWVVLAASARCGQLVAPAFDWGPALERERIPTVRVTIDPSFDVDLPEQWTAAPDEDGGISVSGPGAVGLLHLIAFEQPLGQDLDPAEELYVFLEDQGIELQEDEIEDLPLEGGADLSLCEYVTEEEEEEGEDEVGGAAEEGETTYWIIAVATIPGNLVFASYSCPADAIEAEREAVRAMLATLRLNAPADGST